MTIFCIVALTLIIIIPEVKLSVMYLHELYRRCMRKSLSACSLVGSGAEVANYKNGCSVIKVHRMVQYISAITLKDSIFAHVIYA